MLNWIKNLFKRRKPTLGRGGPYTVEFPPVATYAGQVPPFRPLPVSNRTGANSDSGSDCSSD